MAEAKDGQLATLQKAAMYSGSAMYRPDSTVLSIHIWLAGNAQEGAGSGPLILPIGNINFAVLYSEGISKPFTMQCKSMQL